MIRSTPPPTPVKATSEKIAKKLERARVVAMYRTLLAVLAGVHFVAAVVLTGRGLLGYLETWKNLFVFLLDKPYLAPIIPIALLVLFKGVEMWRDGEPNEIVLPPFPPKPDLRFSNSILIGSAWTRKGKQPGEIFHRDEDDDELFDADSVHVVLNEKGLFGNIQVTGGVGSGKTSTLIQPFIWQGISKYPKPPKPEEFELGPDGRYPAGTSGRREPTRKRLKRFLAGLPAPVIEETPELNWEPYAGMTPEEAQAEYERLLDLHKRLKWGMFIMDPKGDLTEFVLRTAALAGRSDDVIVLRPDGESTYNPLTINANPGVQAELVMDGIEAVSGQPIQQYWRGTMAEWLENALALLRVVDPTRMTFKSVLRLARNESLRTHMVSEAEEIMRRAQEEEERLRRLGREYTGIRVDPAAIEFFRDWDDEEADPQLKRAVVSGIKTQSKFFVNSELAPFLCPEMPPTFNGFDAMIDQGQIVVLRMPLDMYGPVARVLGILVMADAQQAARARINRQDINQDRVVAFCVDEISAYLNQSTKDFIAMNRQSRVCFLAAHQTQGQLVRRGDPGFQDSFKDNLRTKICFSTPNADAARKDASVMGSRQVYKQSITESTSFQRVERIDAEVIAPVSPEGASMSVRMDEVERLWFAPEEFMKLKTGECIIAEFDGETTRPPRKVKAQAFYQTPLQALADRMEIDHRIRPPHPIVRIGTKPRDREYLGSALVQTGYVIIEPLANAQQELEGFKFVTDVGTVIASTAMIDELEHAVEERLTDQQILVLFTDFNTCASYFAGELGFQFERVLSLLDAYRATEGGTQANTFAELYAEQAGELPPYQLEGSWEYHLSPEEHYREILHASRRTIDIFTGLGDRLAAIGDDQLEEMYDATRQRIAAFLAGDGENPPPSGGPGPEPDEPTPSLDELVADVPDDGYDPTALTPSVTPDDPEAYFSGDLDPFAADQFPEELDAPEAETSQPPEPAPATAENEPRRGFAGGALRRAKPRKLKRPGEPLPLFRPVLDDEDVDVGTSTALNSLDFPAGIDEALEAAAADVSAPGETDEAPMQPRPRRRPRTPRRRDDGQATLDLDTPDPSAGGLFDGAPLD